MGKLIISRRKEWSNRGRKFKIFINDENVDYIENGEVKELNLEPGINKVLFKVDWCSSQEIDLEISDEKAKTIEVSGFKIGRWMYPLFYALLAAYFIIKVAFNVYLKELMYPVIPLTLIILYYVSFGRKKYIEIKEL